MDVATFRTMFPEFASMATYPDAMLEIWLAIGEGLINSQAWGAKLTDYAIGLITAHFAANRQRAAAGAPGSVGAIQGVATAKSVDKVSKSMDAGSVTLADGAFWNTTSYGVELMSLARIVGARATQL